MTTQPSRSSHRAYATLHNQTSFRRKREAQDRGRRGARRDAARPPRAARTATAAAPRTPTPSVDGKGKTLKVWLMVDAQSGWKNVVDDANARFTAATGAQVQVDYQQWGDHLAKVDATLAGSDVPDVMELGNTEMPKYVFNGAFAELDKAQFENSATWLTGLSAPCEFDGKTYCVPYYAGARVLIYSTDLFEQGRSAGPDDLRRRARRRRQAEGRRTPAASSARVLHAGPYVTRRLAWVHGDRRRRSPRRRATSGSARSPSRPPRQGLTEVGRPGQEVLGRLTRPRTRWTRTRSSPRARPA